MSNSDYSPNNRILKALEEFKNDEHLNLEEFKNDKRLNKLKRCNKENLAEKLIDKVTKGQNNHMKFRGNSNAIKVKLADRISREKSRKKSVYVMKFKRIIFLFLNLVFVSFSLPIIYLIHLLFSNNSPSVSESVILKHDIVWAVVVFLCVLILIAVAWAQIRSMGINLKKKRIFISFVVTSIISLVVINHLSQLEIGLNTTLYHFLRDMFLTQLLILISVFYAFYIMYGKYQQMMNASLINSENKIKDEEELLSQIDSGIGEIEKKNETISLDLVEKAIVDLLRENDMEELNEYDTKVPKYRSQQPFRNLGEGYDIYEETENFKKLDEHVEELNRGSLGIAGIRGIGKTALMKALQKKMEDSNDTKSFVTVWLSAPTAIDEETFLLSVLAQLASRVGEKLTDNPYWPDKEPKEKLTQAHLYRNMKKCKHACFIFGGMSVLCWIVVNGLSSIEWIEKFWPDIVVIVTASILAVILLVFCILRLKFIRNSDDTRRSTLVNDPNHGPIIVTSKDMLEVLWYQRRHTSSSQISFSYFGFGFSDTSGSEKTRQPFTLPHLIEMWNNYVRYITQEANNGFNKVVIFVDEIDKISTPEKIGEFMRILKALYSPENLFFVVSISQDAYDRFQKRKSPSRKRDEFDSSFDHILRIGRIKFGEIKKILDENILGYNLPIPIVLFIWMVSRGNPRDALRITREICMNYQEEELSLFARKICIDEFKLCYDCNQDFAETKKLNFEGLFSTISDIDDDYVTLVEFQGFSKKLNSSSYQPKLVNGYRLFLAEWNYILTVFELFCGCSITFQDLFVNNKKKLEVKIEYSLSCVQEYLSKGVGDQTFTKLNEFRNSVKLAVISFAEVE